MPPEGTLHYPAHLPGLERPRGVLELGHELAARRSWQESAVVLVGGIGIRKQVANIAESRGAEEGVRHCMQDDIAVAVADGPFRVWHADSAQDERPAAFEPVRVVAASYAHAVLIRFRRRRRRRNSRTACTT